MLDVIMHKKIIRNKVLTQLSYVRPVRDDDAYRSIWYVRNSTVRTRAEPFILDCDLIDFVDCAVLARTFEKNAVACWW